jgi:glycosyltransferase involved in cell wall biosynthesis
MPARDEAPTVARNVAAAQSCQYVREVIVVDDGSTDGTADLASAAGAKVVRRDGSSGSKAHAMRDGVAATDADAILFVDADCTGLTPTHLDAIARPYVEGSAVMSIGAFDYGWFWNPMVTRWPPLSGERVIPRWVFDAIPEEKLDGYTIEVRINQVIAEGHHATTVRTMRGVSHRTKRDKHGTVEGYRRTYWMYRELLRMLRPVGDVRWRTYWFYLRNLTVERD